MSKAAAGSFTHGSSGYTNYACRCDVCCKGNTERHRLWSWRSGHHRPREQYLAERYPEPPPHGTETRYSRPHCCRCDECRAASTAARRRRRGMTTPAPYLEANDRRPRHPGQGTPRTPDRSEV